MKGFQILELIGVGSFSKVFKVRRQEDNKIYALKQTKLSSVTSTDLNNCLNEIRLLSRIHHPNIIQYKEAFVDNSSLCLVMQLAQRGDFLQWLLVRRRQRSRLSEQQLCVFCRQMANGLALLHKMKIIHRDVKADNFYIGRDEQIKLGDMNVSSISKNGMANTKMGTPYYTSPQIWMGKQYSSATDMWSFGCLLYQMVTFSHPFTGRDAGHLKQNVIKGQYSPLPVDCPQQIAQIITGCLQVDPSLRLTAAQVIANPYLKAKYLQCKQKTMEKDSMNVKERTMCCARLLKEFTYGSAQLKLNNLPPSNYNITRNKQNNHGRGKSIEGLGSRGRSVDATLTRTKKELTPKMKRLFEIYKRTTPLVSQRSNLPLRVRMLR